MTKAAAGPQNASFSRLQNATSPLAPSAPTAPFDDVLRFRTTVILYEGSDA